MAEFNLVQAVFDRTALAANEDVAVCTMHIRKHIAFAPDVGPIDDTIRGDFNTKWNTFWTAIRPIVSNRYTFRELRMYDVPSAPGEDMGAPKKIYPYNAVATGSGTPLPPQMAISVTFKTAERKRWGRFYLPGITTTNLDTNGRLLTSAATTIANAAAALCSRSGTGANLTVFSRVHWNDQDVLTVQVDDIVDVIRRRRFSTPLTRTTAAVT